MGTSTIVVDGFLAMIQILVELLVSALRSLIFWGFVLVVALYLCIEWWAFDGPTDEFWTWGHISSLAVHRNNQVIDMIPFVEDPEGYGDNAPEKNLEDPEEHEPAPIEAQPIL